MILTTRLKLRTIPCLWFLLIGILIIETEDVTAHAPPRALYYGHRVEPREPLQHLPSSLVYGSAYDMPTCNQLRFMWQSSVNDLMDYKNKNHNLLTNEIPTILNNPYYTTLLWRQKMLHQNSKFGKIETEPKVHAKEMQKDSRTHHYGKSSSQDSAKEVNTLPGHFMDKPNKIGVVYGHVVYSPEEGVQSPQLSESDNKHPSTLEMGVFGDFVPQSEEMNESTDIDSQKTKQSSVKQQRTSSLSTAEDIFKSGVWHNKPVIPSVSFQRFH